MDILILIILVLSAFGGLKNGLIKSLLSLIGLVVGVAVAGRFYEPFSGVLAFISSERAAHIAAFVIIFLLVIIIFTILGIILTRLVSAILLGWLNRLLGAIFSVIMGAIFIAAILAIWAKYMGAGGPIEGSFMARFLLDSFPIVLGLLPKEFDTVREFFN